MLFVQPSLRLTSPVRSFSDERAQVVLMNHITRSNFLLSTDAEDGDQSLIFLADADDLILVVEARVVAGGRGRQSRTV